MNKTQMIERAAALCVLITLLWVDNVWAGTDPPDLPDGMETTSGCDNLRRDAPPPCGEHCDTGS